MRRVHPNSLAIPTRFNTNTNGQRLHFLEETISISDRAPCGKWATAGFDVLIVCACVCASVCVKFTSLKLRLIDGTKASATQRKWRWWKKTQGIKDTEGESGALLWMAAAERQSGWHVGSQLNEPWLAAVRGRAEAFRLPWPGLGIPCVCTCGVSAVICISQTWHFVKHNTPLSDWVIIGQLDFCVDLGQNTEQSLLTPLI